MAEQTARANPHCEPCGTRLSFSCGEIGPGCAAVIEPDWADLREMARNAGWTRRTLARDWFVWDDKESFVHIRRHPLGFLKISLGGDFGDVALNDPTPARVLTIARELGIGGTS